MKQILATITVALAAILGMAGTANAEDRERPIVRHCAHEFQNGSQQVYCRTRKPEVQEVTWVHRVNVFGGYRYHVTLSNGALYNLIPCRLEDSRNCFWNARLVGNRIGRSFANIRGRVIYLHKPTKLDAIPDRPPVTDTP